MMVCDLARGTEMSIKPGSPEMNQYFRKRLIESLMESGFTETQAADTADQVQVIADKWLDHSDD